MATDMTLFKGNPLVNSDLFKSLMDMNKTLAGGGGSGKRISIRGRRFRMMVDGEQIAVKKEDTLNVVIINAANLTRTYYSADFDPDNPTPPDCWSVDTRAPAPEVPEESRQAARCADCPMNIKGSGKKADSRACRYSQRMAVVLEGAMDDVYQMQIPAASIFGDAQGNNMSLQAYTKFLNAHNTPVVAVLTQLRFDDDADAPKLFFSPVRPLTEEELQQVLEARESDAAKRAIEFIVAAPEKKSEDGDIPIPTGKAKTKPKAADDDEPAPPKKRQSKTRAAVEDEDDADEDDAPPPRKAKVEEVDEDDDPVVVDKKTKPVAGGNADKLASILQGWDDE